MADLNQSFVGARQGSHENLQAIAIPDKIFHIVGSNPHVISRPDNYRTLVCKVEVGTIRIKTSEVTDELQIPDASDQAAGEGSVAFVPADGVFLISAGEVFTVQGSAGGDILTYWWLK